MLSQRSISTLRKFDLHGSDFTAHRGRSVGAFLHIPQGREGAREKRATARWGVCKAPTGASPRNPQLPHSSVVPSRNPLQIRDICRTGPAQMPLICLICKSLRPDFDRTRPASAAHQNRGRNFPFRHLPVGPVSCPTPTLSVFSRASRRAEICREHLQISCKRGQNRVCSNYAECSRYSQTCKFRIFIWQIIPVQPM